MEIKLPLNPQSQLALAQIKDNPLPIKIGQIVDVSVLRTKQDTHELTLQLGNKTLQLQSDQPLVLTSGDKLKLEVTRLIPSLEFKVVNLTPDATPPPLLTSAKQPLNESMLLKIPVVAVEPTVSESKSLPTALQTNLAPKEPIMAKVVTVSEHQVQLQWLTDAVETKPKLLNLITLDRATTALLKPGQTVILEPIQSGLTPHANVSNSAPKITELIKQYLPIHESPVQLIEHLINNMPALQQNESVPEALKRLAEEIMQNLPRQQQLTEGVSIKQAANQSGLFLEAKLAGMLENSPSSLATDFKAQLLKMIDVLKHETGTQLESKSTPAELESLKTLLQKSESSIAKIILDQLASLPKEEATQQLWHLEIPFLDKGKAESVKIEIERDDQKKESGDTTTWSVTITITPPNLGTLHCKVSYLDGAINTHFWSQQPAVTRLIKQNIDTLRRQLEDSGLKTGHMDALEGEPAQPRLQGLSGKNLLDEKV